MTCNRPAAWIVVTALAVPLLIPVQPAAAQAPIPDAIKTGTEPERQRIAVQQYIKAQVERLSSTDPAARAAARDALVSESGATAAPSAGANAPTASYIDVYATELNAELSRVLTAAETPMEAKLNAAIVVQRVARGDRNARLEPSAKAAMSAKADPVALWGVKASAQLVPASLGVRPRNNDLLAQVLATTQARKSDVLVVDAYDALTLTTYSTPADQLRVSIPDARWRELVPLVWPALAKHWSARLERFDPGAGTNASGSPVDPSAEQIPASFVGSVRTWPALQPAQQLEAAQLLINQLSAAAERVVAGGDDREAFGNVARRTAAALSVIGDTEGNAALRDAGRAAAGLGPNATVAAVRQAATAVITAARAVPKFAKLQPPPVSTRPS